MDAFANYDTWKLATPEHYDREDKLNGTLTDVEIEEVEHEGRYFYANLTVEFSDDKVVSVEITSLESTDLDGHDEVTHKEEDFKYFTGLFDNPQVHQKLHEDNCSNEALL